MALSAERSRRAVFWRDLDREFLHERTPEVLDALAGIGGPDFCLERWRASRRDKRYPLGFLAEIYPRRDCFLYVAAVQETLIERHFQGDPVTERLAFEEFALEILTTRGPSGETVAHRMAATDVLPPIGFHQWHAFARAVVLLGADASRWLRIDRLVGLSWAINAAVRSGSIVVPPTADYQPLLERLRADWLTLSEVALDDRFDADPFPTPIIPPPIGE